MERRRPTLTVTLSAAVVESVKRLAAERGKSVSVVVDELLVQAIQDGQDGQDDDVDPFEYA